jgi:phage repressor protein C with HTH and peptisase S24 domain
MKRDAGQWFLSSDNANKTRYPDKLCDEHAQLIGRVIYKQSERI